MLDAKKLADEIEALRNGDQEYDFICNITGYHLRLFAEGLRSLSAAQRPADCGALKLGDLVCMAMGSPFYHDWRGVEMKIVSLRIEPDGKQWASVIDKPYGQHRGNGYYDGETTDIDCSHLCAPPSTEGK